MSASARIYEHAFGVSWLMEDRALRTSHALAVDGRVWLIDPVDEPVAMERTAALGTPAGVIQLLDRHNRDCAAIAGRLGVAHLRVPDDVPDAPFRAIPLLRRPRWRETALWWPEHAVLVVAEALGTVDVFTARHGVVGMHPILRVLPPGALRGYVPEHLLVGHGRPVSGPDARAGVEWAYAHARSDLPRAVAMMARALLPIP